ncbi:MAG: beta-aspartyl-peptidase [Lachnospiraceae bacterium]|uniref:Isoaspartyl dipeptidase n=1 Tax=Candidatus Enterocloster excrementigallinarum TaxID=2838558 RepID=A0A9D2PUE0_9FIRM|nr:beta-aspartyl-peptidase [Lachnospiraceae bacterium]HJC66589.1 beta-aspartyl-peptidase [Candidatus Enterocloster excrementigallinarum]
MMNLLLIQQADIYAPEHLGKMDVLVGQGKILKIAEHLGTEYGDLPVEIVEASGLIMIPGFVDQHVHVIGAGGEAGYYSRTPEMQVSQIVSHGITTVVGLHGTDGTARNIEALYAKVCALEQEGITARMLTGSFEMPSATLTGSVRRDILFVDQVIGTKTALSDRRSAQPTRTQMEQLISQAYTAGLVSGKRGYTHIHMGAGKRRLSMLMDIIMETELPPYLMIPTHINRDEGLFAQSIEFAKLGGIVDVTSGVSPEYGFEGTIKPSQAIRRLLEAGVDVRQITMSSDANGCMAVYDSQGNCTGLCAASADTLYKEFCSLVSEEKIPMETALQVVTSSPAAAIGMYPQKGHLAEGGDGDLILLDQDLSIRQVYAMGRLAVKEGQVLLKGAFE